LIIVAFMLIVAGPQLADFTARHLAFGSVFVWTWKVVQWPIAFALVAVGIGLIYYFAPDAEQFWGVDYSGIARCDVVMADRVVAISVLRGQLW
jgi:uncharacterized BrkB/YihY/UPF0761 family membrane protein